MDKLRKILPMETATIVPKLKYHVTHSVVFRSTAARPVKLRMERVVVTRMGTAGAPRILGLLKLLDSTGKAASRNILDERIPI